jgi:hypothetical protein
MHFIDRPTRRHLESTVLRLLPMSLLASMLAAAAMAQAGKIDFEVLPVPENMGLSDSHSNTVLRSARDWRTWLNNLPGVVENLPIIDFDRETLLVANAGYKTGGPYDVMFDSITDTGNEILVHVSVSGPAKCPSVPEAGHYVAMVLIPHTDKPVHFEVTTKDSTCGRR